MNVQTGSQDLVNLGISTFTGSQNVINSSVDVHILNQSIQTGSQDLVNLGISTFTGSLRSEVNLIEAYTASLKGAIVVSGTNVEVLGTLTAQEIYTTYVTSSVMYQSGSTKFGDTSDDTHQITGSLNVTGSVNFTNALTATRATFGDNVGMSLLSSAYAITPLTIGGNTMFMGTSADGNTNSVIGTISSQVRNYGAGIAQSSFASIEFVTDPTVYYRGGIRFLVNGVDGTSTSPTTALDIASSGASTFSSTVNASGLTVGTSAGSTINITTNNNNGTSGSPLATKLNFLGYNGNVNGQILVNDIAGTVQVGNMSFYTWNSAAVHVMQLKSNADIEVVAGNLIMGTAGKGIDFSATSNGSGTTSSELLNDYEEGTWTPTVVAASGTYTTVTNQRGTYTKIGRQVTVQFYFIVSDKGTGTAGAQITNLPFTVKSTSAGDQYVGSMINTSTSVISSVIAGQNDTFAGIYKYDGTDPITATQGNAGSLTYFV